MGGGLEINSGNSKSVLLENGSSRHGKTRNIELHSNSGWSNGDSILVTVSDSFKVSNHHNWLMNKYQLYLIMLSTWIRLIRW